MGYQPTHNGQYDGYQELSYQQQPGMTYLPQMQPCSSAGKNLALKFVVSV